MDEKPERYCVVCSKALSRYNTGDRCFSHPLPKREITVTVKGVTMTAEEFRQQKARGQMRQISKPTLPAGRGDDPGTKCSVGSDDSPPQRIIAAVAKHFDVTVDDLLSESRKQPLALVRQIAMYVLRSNLGRSFPQIAYDLNRRDHTTVMHGVRHIERLLVTDSNLACRLKDLHCHLISSDLQPGHV